MRLFLIKILFLIALTFSLSGCETLKSLSASSSSSAEKEDEYKGWNDKKFYDNAKEALDDKNYQKAIKLYEALEARYPFGDYAAQVQLDAAYAYYKNDEPDAAIAAAERFIKTHPTEPHVDYAYYLKGLINYNRGITFVDRFLPTDATQRDPGGARDAYDNFAELIRRFPSSQYVADARLRMVALRNNLAMYEVNVARFYMKRKAYLAAVNRANKILKDYQKTPAVPYALEIMQEAYSELGLKDLAADAKRIYAQNYPNGVPVISGDKTVAEELWDTVGLDK